MQAPNLAAAFGAALLLVGSPGVAAAGGSHAGHDAPLPGASGGGHQTDPHGDHAAPAPDTGDGHDGHAPTAATGPDTPTRIAVIAGFGAVNAGIIAAAAAAGLRRVRVRA